MFKSYAPAPRSRSRSRGRRSWGDADSRRDRYRDYRSAWDRDRNRGRDRSGNRDRDRDRDRDRERDRDRDRGGGRDRAGDRERDGSRSARRCRRSYSGKPAQVSPRRRRPPASAEKRDANSSSASSGAGTAKKTGGGSRAKRKERESQYWAGRMGDTVGADSGSGPRYVVERVLGQGTYARVYQCQQVADDGRGGRYAVKIARADSRYVESAEEELQMLDVISKKGGEQHCCVNYLAHFSMAKAGSEAPHICIVFPQYGPCVYSVMTYNLKTTGVGGYSVDAVRSFTFQILTALKFLHGLQIIHTDLKPENVLFRTSQFLVGPDGYRTMLCQQVVLIDFGSATFDDDADKDPIIQTRHYRAPEVVLGLGWSMPADIWSAGIMAVELLTGACVFMTHTDEEHLALMEQTLLEPPPEAMRRRARDRGFSLYARDLQLQWPADRWPRGPDQQRLRSQMPLSEQCEGARDSFTGHNEFYDLIRDMLRYDPSVRMTAREALRSPYMQHGDWHVKGRYDD
eukprot:TRINITY_DN29843_c0_g1_i1.p1 TRINITY_DN29843_c0_g1~~TRINITY_DN29843_c0_g1_i1.p1  ORF type:complete len:514 (+),score=78.36 TRINITY_DN29843_c0_g1_i1:127-1668(+)